ncbi:ABC transporter permease [Sphingobacterium spiritivorum]|uniref:ABC transporter permease n=1 Tax=Sphingobacterium TaxID=28453 RepID=UPI0019195C6B|nr:MULTISPECIES: ABC transporter permease [Sphingobacterium]QQT27475.1 ABC transporter permease [Sphingobacterium spiritivorum]
MELNFEFKKERKLGEFVQDFVDLLKIVIRHFCATLFRLAVIPLAILLLLVFYLTTKVDFNADFSAGDMMQIWGLFIGIVCVLLLLSTLFFGIAIEYFILLKNQNNLDFGSTEVWNNFKSNFGKYFRFFGASILVMLIMIIPFFFVLIIASFIPFVGNIVAGVLMSLIGVWLFCAFMLYREGYYSLGSCFNEAYHLLKKKVYDYGVSSYIVSAIFQVMLMMMTLIPALILGLIAYNTVGFNDNFFDTFSGKLIVSLGGTIFSLVTITSYMFSVLISGLIYESAKELRFGENIYETINNIGKEANGH